jgi:hypothetical protein
MFEFGDLRRNYRIQCFTPLTCRVTCIGDLIYNLEPLELIDKFRTKLMFVLFHYYSS